MTQDQFEKAAKLLEELKSLKTARDTIKSQINIRERQLEYVRPHMKWIQIWYSWGDQESPVEVPAGADPWEFLKGLIINEVEVSQEEYPYGCTVWMYPDNNCAEIKYLQDESYCYYLITDEEEYEPDDSYFDVVRLYNE